MPLDQQTAPSIASLTAPVAMGYIPLGAVFGFLFVQAGGAAWLAILASLLVYAGAAQFMMIPMLAAGASIGAIALATLVLNLRHAFYGLSLLSQMPARRWQRWYAIFGLTDETYSVLTALPPTVRTQRMVLITALNHSWWVLGTALGAMIGANAHITLDGLDFVLASLFAVLAVEQWRARADAVPIWVALASYGIAHAIAPTQALALAIALSLLACAVRPARRPGAAKGTS
ncbi:MAG TPA: AzlC family ABC transporter permease [Castellaniella sp.]|nr:AzlC family ABC transporter permease [Castellaniella sp.]